MNRLLNNSKQFLEGFRQFYILSYKFYKYTILDLVSALRNRNTFSIKKFSKNLFFFFYLLYTIYSSYSFCKNIVKIGYWNSVKQSFYDNIYIYYFLALVYTLSPIYVYFVKPIVKKINKYKLLKSFYPKLMELLYQINLENCDKEGCEAMCNIILKNDSVYSYFYSYKNVTHNFLFKRFRTEEDEIISYINGYDVLEASIDKLNLNDFHLEYLFFSSNSKDDYKCTIFSSSSSESSLDEKKYPKLFKKCQNHIEYMKNRDKMLKQYTPICDDVINYIISKY
jgi:hypothetical protein